MPIIVHHCYHTREWDDEEIWIWFLFNNEFNHNSSIEMNVRAPVFCFDAWSRDYPLLFGGPVNNFALGGQHYMWRISSHRLIIPVGTLKPWRSRGTEKVLKNGPRSIIRKPFLQTIQSIVKGFAKSLLNLITANLMFRREWRRDCKAPTILLY